MLSDLLVIDRSLQAAGFDVAPRHPAIKSPGRMPAIHVRLDNSALVDVALLPAERVSALWTFRDGNFNSFPFVKLDRPLLSVLGDNADWASMTLAERRKHLRALAKARPLDPDQWSNWPGASFVSSLEARREALKKYDGEGLEAVIGLVDAFLRAATEPGKLVATLVRLLLDAIDQGDDAIVNIVRDALCGRIKKKGKKTIIETTAIFWDVARGRYSTDITNTKLSALSAALTLATENGNVGICDLTGERCQLHTGNYPVPKPLGQTYIYSKNADIPAAARYGRFADGGIRVGSVLAQQLAGALETITADHLKGKTWQYIPSETSGDKDRLISFVENVELADIELADAFAEDGEAFDGGAAFLTRTERVIDAIKAKVDGDLRQTPVTVMILRKVDLGNAKVILHRPIKIGELYAAAMDWDRAQRNVPDWLVMPVRAKDKSIVPRGGPAIAPLQLPRVTRAAFIRDGEAAKREPIGITAQDALTLFLNDSGVERLAQSTLRIVLDRQGKLLSRTAHALRVRSAGEWKRNADALRAVTLLGILLAKRGQENYVNETAFKLGQLLGVADVIHAGYCADVRDGKAPPTLLGNSMLAIAQADPTRALAVLSRRWPPYAAWAKRPGVYATSERLRQGKKDEKARGWAIANAVWQARQVSDLTRELHGNLPRKVDDQFRAELLLGYVAGLPRKSGSDAETSINGKDE
jgi:hypothetical protein